MNERSWILPELETYLAITKHTVLDIGMFISLLKLAVLLPKVDNKTLERCHHRGSSLTRTGPSRYKTRIIR